MKTKAEVGKYFFGRYYSIWAIWQYITVTEQGTQAAKVTDCVSYDEALRKTFQLNGWGEPKYINRKY